jgi:phage-related protein
MVWTTLQYNSCYDEFMAKEGRDKRVRAKAVAVLARLRLQGRGAKYPMIENIKDFHGIFEVRTTGNIAVRGIFFFYDAKNEIVFTSFHLKKSKKLPTSVFSRAKNFMEVYDGGHDGISSFN